MSKRPLRVLHGCCSSPTSSEVFDFQILVFSGLSDALGLSDSTLVHSPYQHPPAPYLRNYWDRKGVPQHSTCLLSLTSLPVLT